MSKTENVSWLLFAGVFFSVLASAWLIYTGAEIAMASEREVLIAAIWRHIGYGAVLAPLFVCYLVWRIADYRRCPAQSLVGAVLFWSMIGVLAFLLLSGPVVVWTFGFPVRVFDWFEIPNPIGKLPALHDPLEQAHVVIGYAAALIILADFLAFMRRRLRA
ncbi:MAG: hypothetical protein AAFW68_04420 [Pseudomonadota bacterium]